MRAVRIVAAQKALADAQRDDAEAADELEAFAEEFSSLLSRQAHGHRSASPPRAEPVRAVAGERRDGHGDGQRDGRRDG